MHREGAGTPPPLFTQGLRRLGLAGWFCVVVAVVVVVVYMLPGTVRGRLPPEGLPVQAEGQLLLADGHGTAVAPPGGRRELVLTVLVVVVAEDGHVFLVIVGDD